MNHSRIIDHLIERLKPLAFGPPVTHVYNPLIYARRPHEQYLRRYGNGLREIVLLGMNPGPWGMAQTGVPFGEIGAVTGWLGIDAPVDQPETPHPKRPVEGFGCRRSEVSGRRLWGWAREAFLTPDRFFSRFFVANYCPLVFMEAGGRNRTPNNLPAAERAPLFEACDRALCQTIALLKPERVIGIGNFAAQRAAAALKDETVQVGRISHPSPANPKANRGWQALIENELSAMGISP
jgi:single-strand selective monofunctional uracil DNA glycosylase